MRVALEVVLLLVLAAAPGLVSMAVSLDLREGARVVERLSDLLGTTCRASSNAIVFFPPPDATRLLGRSVVVVVADVLWFADDVAVVVGGGGASSSPEEFPEDAFSLSLRIPAVNQ